MKENHTEIYSNAEYYDIAFDFQNFSLECDFFEDAYTKYTGNKLNSFLELCAGPGKHTIEMSKRGYSATALDSSRGMSSYGFKLAQEAGVKIDYKVADIRNFSLNKKFDLIVILMDSFTYLLSNQDVYDHLNTVAAHLAPQGLYIIELAHPREVFQTDSAVETDWDSERNGIKVNYKCGSENDFFDPITQTTNVSVVMTIEKNGKQFKVNDEAKQRSFTANEFMALIDASQKFQILDFYGSLDTKIPFNNEKKAWRMVPVLQKI